MATRRFWDGIMVNTRDIDLSTPPPGNNSAKELMGKLSKPVDRICFFEVLYKEPKLGLSPTMSHDDVIRHIFGHHSNFFMDLLAIIRFKYKKRHDIISKISKKYLTNAQLKKCTYITPKSKRQEYSYCALLLSLFLKNNRHLKEIFYKNASASKGFKSYRIFPDNPGSPIISIKKATIRGIDKHFLLGFERKRNTSKKSHCWHITKEPSVTEIFIRRDTIKDYFLKVRLNFFIGFCEYIIMKFLEEGEYLELHSTYLFPAESMANYFALEIFGDGFEYLPDEGRVSWKRARTFINSVGTGVDKKFILCRIEVRNTRLPNLPRLVVKSKDDGSIVKDIAELKSKGINLLRLVRDIERMELIFTDTKIPVSIKQCPGKRVEFLYQYNRVDEVTREKFVKYVWGNYGIKVIPFK